MTTPQPSWRDTLAEMMGIERFSPAAVPGPVTWALKGINTLQRWDHHPIPNSLDTIAALWRCLEGWVWERAVDVGRLAAIKPDDTDWIFTVKLSSDERTDRGTLLVKVLEWLKDNDEPAFKGAVEKMREAIR